MDSIFIQIVAVIAGLAIFSGIYVGYPGKGFRSGIVAIAIVIAAAFVIAAIERFAY
jgi:hypothetical protein